MAIIWRCWRSRKPYEEKLYEAALPKANSPLISLLDKVQLGKSPYKSQVNKIKKPVAGSPQR